MLITPIIPWDSIWDKLINYASNCSRSAWPILAQKMKENNFLERERIFVVIENEQIIWFCTFTKEDWIPDCDYTPFVWFAFVDENYRWKRLSEQMIDEVEKYARTLNFEKLYLVSDHKWLYEKYGFKKCDEKVDELGRTETIFFRKIR
jgi:N-acetylglutamate synthase-like GNAT family acetyltransferase